MTNYLKTDFDFNSDALIEVIDELPLWSAPFGIKLLSKVNLSPKIKALDIGFGAGFPLTELAMRLGESSKVYGIDPWEAAVKRAKKKIELYGISNIEILEGVAEDIPIEDASIDLITSNNGINNVEDLDKTLSECARILKSKGQFVQTVNLDSTMHEFYSVLEQVLLEMNLNDCVEKMHKQIYEKRKPLPEFIQKIEANSFSIAEVEEDSFEYKFVDGTTLLNHYFIRLAFLEGWKSIVPDHKQETVFEQVEAKLNQLAKKQGVIKLSVPFVVINAKRK